MVFIPSLCSAQWQSAGLAGASVHGMFRNGSALYAGTADSGAYRSTNNAASWTRISAGLTSQFIKTFAVTGVFLFAGSTTSGVYVSTNDGDLWQPVNNGLTSNAVHALATIGGVVFAGTNGAGVFRSTNNGASWSAVTNGLTNLFVLALVADGAALYAGTGATPADGGVFRTTNNGDSWTLLSGTTVRAVRSLSIRELTSRLYAGCNGPGIFVSTDNGSTWIQRNNGLTNTNVRAVTVESNIHTVSVLAGTNSAGVYASPDALTWFPSNDGLGALSILTLKQLGGYVYAGTSAGVWRRPVPTEVKQVADVPRTFALEQNYPNPFNPGTRILFSIPSGNGRGGEREIVTLNVFDVLGRSVATLVNQELNPGSYEISFDASNLSSGVYCYRLTSGNFSAAKSMIVAR
jgi:photosystem II stability/assembly factor-like uncharacterized protein